MLEKDGNWCSAGNPATWSGEGMQPPDLKQGAQFQNFSAQNTFESPLKMYVAIGGLLLYCGKNNPLKVL